MKSTLYLSFGLVVLGHFSCGKISEKDHKQQPSAVIGSENATLHLAVLGDSLAAGSLAKTELGGSLSTSDFALLMEALNDLETHPDDAQRIANNVNEVFSAPDETAFEGIRDYSFWRRLEQTTGQKVDVRRYAVPGADTLTLGEQIKKMKSDNAASKPQYIVVHVGGNDWCNMRSADEFKKTFTENLNALANENTEARILILPVPDLTKVLSIADTIAVKGTFNNQESTLKCSDVQSKIKMCLKRGVILGASPASVAPQRQEIENYNTAISDAVNALSTAVPQFKGKIAVATSYAASEGFDPTWLGVDCFHPSAKGQNKIADVAWPYMAELAK